MKNESDEKVPLHPRVVLNRLPDEFFKGHVKTEGDKTKNNDCELDVNLKKVIMPSSVKKEKKVFEVVDSMKNGSPEVKDRNIKVEEGVPHNYINPFSKTDIDQLKTLKTEEWFDNKTKIEKDSLSNIITSNSSQKVLRKRSCISNNYYPEKKIKIQDNMTQPLVVLVPPVVKTEEPEVRIVKKINRKEPISVDLDKKSSKEIESSNLSLRDLVEQYKLFSFDLDKSKFQKNKQNISKEDETNQSVIQSKYLTKDKIEEEVDTIEETTQSDTTTLPEQREGLLADEVCNETSNSQAVKHSVCTVKECSGTQALARGNIEDKACSENSINVSNKQDTSNNGCVVQEHSDVSHTTINEDPSSSTTIKVKPPQALGISQNLPQNIPRPNAFCLLKPAVGNESKIAEICRLYPIFFTPDTRFDISILINMLYQLSKEMTSNEAKLSEFDETNLQNKRSFNKTFIDNFTRILKLDQTGLGDELFKKMIPVLYLHIHKAFKILKPNEDFDFRSKMRTIFEAEHFLCKHDVMIEKSYNIFKEIMIMFERWLGDVFIDCDLNDILEADDKTNELENIVLGQSSSQVEDTANDVPMDLSTQLNDMRVISETLDVIESNSDVAGDENFLALESSSEQEDVVDLKGSLEQENPSVASVDTEPETEEAGDGNLVLESSSDQEDEVVDFDGSLEQEPTSVTFVDSEPETQEAGDRNLVLESSSDQEDEVVDLDGSLEEETTPVAFVDNEPDTEDELRIKCPTCKKSLPMCFLCKEVLDCPCFHEQAGVFDTGSESLNFCKEHLTCGDNWTEWWDQWNKESVDDDMPSMAAVCSSSQCNNGGKYLCVCRVRCYCSHSCLMDDWHDGGHYENCKGESDPDVLLEPQVEYDFTT